MVCFIGNAEAQTVVNGTSGNSNNLEITQIVYEVDGTFYVQSSSGSAPSFTDPGPADGTAPSVNLYRIRYTDGSNSFDVFPTAKIPTITNYHPNVGSTSTPEGDISVIKPTEVVFHLDNGSYNDPAYPDAMEDVVSIPDIRSYWDVQTDALGSGNDDFIDVIFDDPIFSDDRIIITERYGNTTMSFQALDSNQNPIGNSVEISGGTPTSTLYDWDTTVQSPFDDNSNGTNDTQAQWMIMFEASQFGIGSETPIYGYRVTMLTSNGGDGKILLFEDPGTLLLNGECWRMLSSSPFQGVTYAEILDPIWTQGVPGADYDGGESNVLLWDNSSTDNSTSGWTTTFFDDTPLELDDVVPPGTGFLVGVYADDDFDGDDDGFPKELSVNGVETSGTITPPMNSNSNGWTLVGNPYGAPIDFSAVAKSNLTNVAYVYDRNYGGSDPGPTNGNTGGWRTTDGSYGDILNGLIAPFQGFFVQNNGSTSTSISFDENDKSRVTFEAPNDEWEFYGKQQKQKGSYVRLEVQGEGLYNSAWITFSERGKYKRIKGDAYELEPFSEHNALLSTRKENEFFDIGHFPIEKDLEVPLNLETTLPGTYTISATEMDLSSRADLVFTDLEEDVTLPLDESFEYEFTVQQAAKANPDPLRCDEKGSELARKFKPEKAKSVSPDRFLIRHASNVDPESTERPKDIALHQNYPNPFNPSTQISYELPRQSDVRLEIYDLTGRLITTLVDGSVEAGIHNITFTADNLSSGVYLYRLQTDEMTLTKKFTLIK